MKAKIFFLLIILLSVSCEENPFESVSNRASEEYQKWKSFGINDYTIIQQRIANFSGTDQAVKIFVNNNQITDIRDTSGTVQIPLDNWKWYRSIDQLFELLIDIKNTQPNQYQVVYEDTYRYPAQLFISSGTVKSTEAFSFITVGLVKQN